jgi:hypothetical protein
MARLWQKASPDGKVRAVKKLDSSLALGRATYERWLGTEPDEITAAADALRHFEPKHPSLVDLEVRLRRARQIKAMLADILHRELASDDDEDWRRL